MGQRRINELRSRGFFIPTHSQHLGPKLWSLWNLASNQQRAAFCTRAGLQPIDGCERDVFVDRRRGRTDRENHKAKAAPQRSAPPRPS
jgi:hypothetical protein